MKKFVILFLAIAMTLTMAGCGKSAEVKAAEELIGAIGEVTLQSGDAIEAAENAVNALDEKELKNLEGADTLQEARTQFEALKLSNSFDQIGEVTLQSESKLRSLRKQYDEASEDVKNAVTNLSVLEKAEADYQTLAKAEEERLQKEKEQRRAEGKAALDRMTTEEDRVNKTTFYLPSAYPEYIDTRSYALCYIGVTESSASLRMKYNYTGSEWIFWEKLTFLIDGKNEYRTYRYSEVNRDNAGRKVWEYIDVVANEADMKLLASIASSSETIIRFEGDGGKRYDLTVPQIDKNAIKDVLAAYEYLSGK